MLQAQLPTELHQRRQAKCMVEELATSKGYPADSRPLFPTIDHVEPVARGGTDTMDNWVCCSMLTNSIKSNWTLDQLQWKIQDRGDFKVWDGMLGWFQRQVSEDPQLSNSPYIKKWNSAATKAIAKNSLHPEFE